MYLALKYIYDIWSHHILLFAHPNETATHVMTM